MQLAIIGTGYVGLGNGNMFCGNREQCYLY